MSSSSKEYKYKELGDCIELVIDHRGKTPKKLGSDWVKNGIPTISAKNVNSGKLVAQDKIRFVTQDIYEKWMKEDVKPGDCFLVSEGATLGECLYWDNDYPVVLGQRIFCIRTNPEILYPRYFYAYMTSNAFQSEVIGRATGSSVPGLRQTEVLKLNVKVLPMEDQIFIGDLLYNINKKVQKNTETNQTLEQIAQAIFKSWFVDFEPSRAKIAAKKRWQAINEVTETSSPTCYAEELDSSNQNTNLRNQSLDDTMTQAAMSAISGKSVQELEQLTPEQQQQLKETAALFPDVLVESELGEAPEGWGHDVVGDLFELHRGFDLPKKDRKEGDYPVFAAGGFHGNNAYFKMEPPGIITGRSGVIGNVYLSLEKYWPLNTTLYVREFKKCGPYFAYFFLSSIDLKSLNSGSAVPSLNRNFVHSLPCVVPGEALLESFEKNMKPLFAKIKANDSEVELLSSIRDGIFPKLLSGKLTLNSAA